MALRFLSWVPDGAPMPTGPLAAAMRKMDELGPQPGRRRAQIQWEKQRAELTDSIERNWEPYAKKLRGKGYCANCLRHIGTGRGLHEWQCNV